MRTIETTAVVTPEHTLIIAVPADVPPGAHRVVVTLSDEAPERGASPLPFGLEMIDIGPWPEGFTASREQLYGDDGR